MEQIVKKLDDLEQKIDSNSLAYELIKQNAKANKRLFIALIAVISLWFATIGIFIWYMQLYDYSGTITEITAEQDGNGVNIVSGGDANYGAEGENQQDF